MLGLQDSVQHLRREIRSLERERETLVASMEPKPNPWSIVAETFHVMELGLQSPCNLVNASTLESSSAMRKSLSYLEKSCAIDVSMGDLRGLDEILQRVLCCSLWCGAPEIKLERIDELAPGVISATARASATVTWSTLHHILPSFETSCNESDDFPSLRLLGQRISFLCQLNFHLDEEDGRLARLESTTDILQPLIHALGLPGACAIAKVASTRIMSNLATHVVFRR
ncbi:Bzip transcription factor [Phytophthora megakarya]|uniref:Bzip transcription factor n=1 Tax=Phytophthora megakarya TaxID=4795 RepID=A0A225VFF1_9STRA|nr:Bzip transcription factor [Phytophthora megakarya]